MLDKQLFALLGNNKKYVIYNVILMVLGLLANITTTACICYAISIVIENNNALFTSYLVPLIVGVVAVIVRCICSYYDGIIRDSLGRKVKKDLRKRTYDKILELGVRSTDEMSMAGLTQVSLEGIEQLDLYYSSYLPQFFYSMIAPFILFAICIGIDWRVSVVLIACVPIIPVSIIIVSKYAKKIFNKYWGIYTSMGDGFLDSLQGLKELKIFAADEERHKVINKKSEDFRVVTMKVLVMQLASITIMDLVAFAGAGAGTAFAIYDMVNRELNPAVALFLVLIAVEFFLPLRSLGSAFHIAMNGASAGKKIFNLLQTPSPVWGDLDLANSKLEIKDVTFSYDKTRNVLNDINMTFEDKKMTAIVGESGCGKSTIVNLLIGAIKPDQGKVIAGGNELETIKRENYYGKIASVSYNTYIFNESVRDNFYLAKPSATDEEMMEALKKVNLLDFVKANGGLDKVITEDANNISGGQKQRLALAINLVSNKDIYIFDEATSNIDVESESIIMKNVKEMSKTKNVIVISHRLENIVIADKIYFMQDGSIKEEGTHQELMKLNGGYNKLYTTQKELEEGYKNYLDAKEVIE